MRICEEAVTIKRIEQILLRLQPLFRYNRNSCDYSYMGITEDWRFFLQDDVWYDDERMRDDGESMRNDGESMRIEVKQYGSETCAPCMAIRRKLEEWQRAHPTVNYSYFPIEDHQEEAAQKGILSVPTVIAVIDGTEVARESGYFSLDKMLARLERYMKMAGETEL